MADAGMAILLHADMPAKTSWRPSARDVPQRCSPYLATVDGNKTRTGVERRENAETAERREGGQENGQGWSLVGSVIIK